MNPFRTGVVPPEAGAPVPWAENAYELAADSAAGITVSHEAGAFYLQDPGAMLPAAVMAARPGERILDLCAAPGGKTTQMGLDMAGEGLLVSNEPVPKRAAVLSRNVERMGIPNCVVTCAWPDQLAEKWPEGFDGVMVDAPCSGEGMFRKDPETRTEWTEEKAAGCARRQAEILDAAARLVRPGGRLVYATCTWNPAENGDQIAAFLSRHPDFSPEPFRLPGAEGTDGTFTCWPHRTRGGGQFTALLRRAGDGEAALPADPKIGRPDRAMLQAWRDSGAGTETPDAVLGSTLIHLAEIPDCAGIRTLRTGLSLGEIRGKLFLPDHAAAMGIRRPDAPETALDDADALKYLAGETVEGGARGWTVMTWRGLPLGWGKGSGGVIRNHYPKGLRNARLIIP